MICILDALLPVVPRSSSSGLTGILSAIMIRTKREAGIFHANKVLEARSNIRVRLEQLPADGQLVPVHLPSALLQLEHGQPRCKPCFRRREGQGVHIVTRLAVTMVNRVLEARPSGLKPWSACEKDVGGGLGLCFGSQASCMCEVN